MSETRRGYTIGVYLPPEATDADINEIMTKVADAAYNHTGAWDPFVVGLAGDQLGIDSDLPDGTHIYMSTSCLHGDHEHCKAMVGTAGEKRPGRCKHCDAVCRCATCGHESPAAVAGPATGSEERSMLAPGSYPKAVGEATMAADMCPRCKGDNSEAWALCPACEAEA